MSWCKVRNWDKWQTYRNDRAAPPWIKIHRRIILDPDFVMLSDIEKAHLVSIWILAADRNGWIKNDSKMIQKITGLETEPDLERFQVLGFIEKPRRHVDATLTEQRRQDVALEKKRIETPLPPLEGGAVDKNPQKKIRGREQATDGQPSVAENQIAKCRHPDRLSKLCRHHGFGDPPAGMNFETAKEWAMTKAQKRSQESCNAE